MLQQVIFTWKINQHNKIYLSVMYLYLDSTVFFLKKNCILSVILIDKLPTQN